MTEYWFDTRDGALLVGEAAYEARQEEAGPDMADVVKLGELLLADEFPIDESYKPPGGRVWDREEVLEIGCWVLQVLKSEVGSEDPLLTREHLYRLSKLGLGPSLAPVRRHFGTLGQFREEIGYTDKYGNWSQDQFAAYAKKVARRVGGRPTRGDYTLAGRLGDGPNIDLIAQRGGVRALNELIGYPDITSWDHDDYVLWGARVKDANNGSQLTARMLGVLSKRKRGPSPGIIASPDHFGSLAKFQAQVDEEWARQQATKEMHLQEGTSFYKELVAQDAEGVLRASVPSEQMAIVARYRIAKDCVPDVADAQCRAWAALNTGEFTSRLRNHRISKAHVEMVAVSLDLFDDLWPMDDYKEYLYVSSDDLLPKLLIDRKHSRRRWPHRRAKSA